MEGGSTGALNLAGTFAGLVVAFVTMPGAYAMSWPWLSANILWQYSEGVQSWAPFLWSALLFCLIYAVFRAALMLTLALGGLALTLLVIFRRWKD